MAFLAKLPWAKLVAMASLALGLGFTSSALAGAVAVGTPLRRRKRG